MIGWVEPRWPYGNRLRVVTTTRRGGCSRAPYDGFNLATHVGDDPEAVRSNRAHLDTLLGSLPIQWLEQVHGTDVVRASADGTVVPVADGAWTDQPSLVLGVLTADCLPVVLADERFRNLAVVHAGWRGLVAGVLGAGCRALPFPPRIAWLGPAIGPGAYEVGPEVLEAVARLAVPADVVRPAASADKGYLDLFGLAGALLAREGIEAVYCERRCTWINREFYSYRRDGITGRMATLAWLSR